MPETTNPLSGLLGQYDSDSDHENVNGQESLKLDAKVDNFLQEINQIAPEQKNTQKQNAWQECFDESTGYPYYWNVETNAVTWEMPPEYKQWVTQANKPIIPELKSEIKPEQPIIVNAEDSKPRPRQINKKKVVKKKFEDAGSSEDEKIVMITSFSESSSESENEKSPNEEELKIQQTDKIVSYYKI